MNENRRSMFRETRANPTGINQYTKGGGSAGPVVSGGGGSGGNAKIAGTSISENEAGDAMLKGGLKYSEATAVISVAQGDRGAAARITSTPEQIGDAMLHGGAKYSATKVIVDKVSSAKKRLAYEKTLVRPGSSPRPSKIGLVDYSK